MLGMASFNPIAIREMRARMRGPRAFLLLISYLSLLSALIYLIYVRSGGGTTYSYPQTPGPSSNLGPTVSYQIGQNIYIGIFLFLFVIVSIVTPAITAGSISREVEDRTHDLLLITPAYGRTIAFGKLFAALAFVFFLIISALPLTCIVFVFGGVSINDILLGLALLLVTAFAYGAIGLFFSALFQRTIMAIIFSYTLILLLVVGSWLVSSSIVSVLNADAKNASRATIGFNPNTDPAFDLPKRILLINPVAALGAVLTPGVPYRTNVGDDLQFFPSSSLFGGNVTRYYALQNYLRTNGGSANNEIAHPLWVGYMLLYAIIALSFFTLALLRLRPVIRPVKQKRLKAKAALDRPEALVEPKSELLVNINTAHSRIIPTPTTQSKPANSKQAQG
jgi:ABC-type transport system involved in multi-copper enzyme maturation permease subunit